MGLEHPSIREDRAINNPETAEVGPGERATFTWTPENTGTTFVLPELSVSKHPETTYEVKLDGSTRFEAPIPPTDIDDSGQTFLPPITFEQELTVIVRNFSDSTRDYHAQPKGWETDESLGGGS
jgi:hypothetical protein